MLTTHGLCLATVFFSLLVLLAFVVFVYLIWNFNYWKKRQVFAPKAHILSGTFPKTVAGKCNLVEELHEIYLRYKYSHRLVGVFSARNPKLFILDPKLAKEVLTKNFSSFHDNESSKWSSAKVEQLRLCSPFVSKGDDWKDRRAELVPALTMSRLRTFYSTMRECAVKMTSYLESQLHADYIDTKELANRYTAEFMANFIWGIEADAFGDTQPYSTIHMVADLMIVQALKCVRYYGRTAAWPWLRRLSPMRFFPSFSDRFFKSLTTKALNARLANPAERCDVINHLLQLQSKKPLNDIQMAGHTTTVLIDGFETGAIVISHCLLLLARNARVQQKLRKELSGLTDYATSFEALNEQAYLDQCIQETLRIFPPLPTLFKLCTKPIVLQHGDAPALHLEKDDVVYISSYSFHRDADIYENPEQFWPERFDVELGGVRKYREMGAFLPFGDGPRMCLGMKLGLIEAKVAVAEIVRNFEISSYSTTREDNKIAADSFLLTLDGSIRLQFKKLQ